MKKALLLAAAIATTAPACAEWVHAGTTENGNKHFIDPAAVRITGNLRRFWKLVDHAKPDRDGDLSAKGLQEVDCAEDRYRVLQATYFKGHMGSGTSSTATDPAPTWTYIEPDSIGAIVQKVVCNLR